jgi:hypothetical protein
LRFTINHTNGCNALILSDEDFDEVVRADIQLIRQAWADMEKAEKPFTPIINKSKKRTNNRLRVSDNHITLVLGVSHPTYPYILGRDLGNQ